MTAIPPTPIDEIREPAWRKNPPPSAANPNPEATGPAPSASAPSPAESSPSQSTPDTARPATASAGTPQDSAPHHTYTLQDSGLHQGEVLHQVEEEIDHDLGPLSKLMHTDWDRARHAARVGWERLERMLPGHHRPH